METKLTRRSDRKGGKVDEKISGHLQKIDEQVLYNQQRLLSLFRKHRVAEEDLVGSTGYGFDDMGRENLKRSLLTILKSMTL